MRETKQSSSGRMCTWSGPGKHVVKREVREASVGSGNTHLKLTSSFRGLARQTEPLRPHLLRAQQLQDLLAGLARQAQQLVDCQAETVLLCQLLPGRPVVPHRVQHRAWRECRERLKFIVHWQQWQPPVQP